ncbi:MAG: YciI family protein [Actinomycetota bacterium]
MAKYLLSIYGDETELAKMAQDDLGQVMKEYWAFGDEVEAAGAFIAGEALKPTPTATTVHTSQEGKSSTTDGPFAETKEQLGGFYLLECKDQAEAVKWAKKIPAPTVEVREIQEFERP